MIILHMGSLLPTSNINITVLSATALTGSYSGSDGFDVANEHPDEHLIICAWDGTRSTLGCDRLTKARLVAIG